MYPKEKVLSLWGEFRQFAFKGNVIDMAVGVVIGAAFAKIIESLVKNVIMPLINLMTPSGVPNYTEWTLRVAGKEVPFGHFLGDVVSFLVVALALFFFTVKFLGWILRTKKEETAAPPPPPDDVRLLTEIRDLLKDRTVPAQSPPSANL